MHLLFTFLTLITSLAYIFLNMSFVMLLNNNTEFVSFDFVDVYVPQYEFVFNFGQKVSHFTQDYLNILIIFVLLNFRFCARKVDLVDFTNAVGHLEFFSFRKINIIICDKTTHLKLFFSSRIRHLDTYKKPMTVESYANYN